MTNFLADILQAEYNCELAGLPHGINRGANDLHILTDKLHQLKDSFLNDWNTDPDAEEFIIHYLDVMRIFKSELDRMDTMSDEFCSSYLEALKPGAIGSSGFGFDDKGLNAMKSKRSPEDPNSIGGSYEGSYHPNANHRSRRGNLPKSSTNILKKWLFDHLFHPYPTEEEKSSLSLQTNLNLNQISNWFINARRRTLQPMLESVRQQQQEGGLLEGEVEIPQMPPLQVRRSSKRKNINTSIDE